MAHYDNNDYARLRDILLGKPEYFRWVDAGPIIRRTMLNAEKTGAKFNLQTAMASLDIVELNPPCDIQNKTAELVVELVESLFGERTLARTHEKEKYRL